VSERDLDRLATNIRAVGASGLTTEEVARAFGRMAPVFRKLRPLLIAGLERRIESERMVLAAIPWWRLFDQWEKRREIAQLEALLDQATGTQS
jgi:hypothetical protein